MRLIDADELKGKAFAAPDDGEHIAIIGTTRRACALTR